MRPCPWGQETEPYNGIGFVCSPVGLSPVVVARIAGGEDPWHNRARAAAGTPSAARPTPVSSWGVAACAGYVRHNQRDYSTANTPCRGVGANRDERAGSVHGVRRVPVTSA